MRISLLFFVIVSIGIIGGCGLFPPPDTSQPFSSLDSPYCFVDEVKDKAHPFFVVIDTDSDELYTKIRLKNISPLSGYVHLAPNGNYYFINAAYHPSTWSYGQASAVVMDPREGEVINQIPLPQTTDSMTNITAAGKFLCYALQTGKFTIVDTSAGDSTESFTDPLGPDDTEGPYVASMEGTHSIAPRPENAMYYIKENARDAALYRLDGDTGEQRNVFFWKGLYLSQYKVEIDAQGDKAYVGIYTALDMVHTPKQAPLELEIIDIATGTLEKRVSLPSTEDLFGCKGERDEVYISNLRLDPDADKLYLFMTLNFPENHVRTSLVTYDLASGEFTPFYTVDDIGFNEIDVINGKLYCRCNDYEGEDWVLRVDPETGAAKWILGGP